jgi:IS30 family transposase
MPISHETIYQPLYVHGRGVQHRELTECLCTGRALPKPRARIRHRGRRPITPDIMISARPAEVNDRAVPGPPEGDLIIGLVHACTGQYQPTSWACPSSQ